LNLAISSSELAKHLLVRGTTGSGKTGALLSYIWQLALDNYPAMVVVDPVGSLYEKTEEFMAGVYMQMSMSAMIDNPAWRSFWLKCRREFFSKIDLLDFTKDDNPFFFNPLEKTSDLTADDTAEDFIRCFSRVTQGDMSQQLRRNLVLGSACRVVSELGGNLRDVHLLLYKRGDDINSYVELLTRKAEAEGKPFNLEHARDYLKQHLAATKGRERQTLTESSINALALFLNSEKTRRFVSATKGNLDFNAIINDGRYLFVNIPPSVGSENTQNALASLIVNRVQTIVMKRDKNLKKKPVILLMDEFHRMMGKEWANATSVVRNLGLRLILSHQNESQLLEDNDGRRLLEEIMSNTTTHIYFRQGEHDAKEAVYSVFKPRGDKEKHRYEETARSSQQSIQMTFTQSVTQAIGEAFAVTEGKSFTLSTGQQITFSHNNAISRAAAEGLTVSKSETENWSRVESKNYGITVTNSNSETSIDASGMAQGTSQGEGENTQEGSSQGYSSGANQGEGHFYSFSNGDSSMSRGGVDVGLMAMDSGSSSHHGHGDSTNSSRTSSDMESTHRSRGSSLFNAISDVVSKSKALAHGKSRAVSGSRGEGVAIGKGGGITKGQSKSLSKSLAVIESYCKSMAESIGRAQAVSKSKTRTTSKTVSNGQSTGVGLSFGEGTTKTEKVGFYSVGDQAVVEGYELAHQEDREAFVVNRKTGDVTRIRTLDIPFDFELDAFGKNYLDEMKEKTHPKQKAIVPSGTLFERLEVEKQEEARKNRRVGSF